MSCSWRLIIIAVHCYCIASVFCMTLLLQQHHIMVTDLIIFCQVQNFTNCLMVQFTSVLLVDGYGFDSDKWNKLTVTNKVCCNIPVPVTCLNIISIITCRVNWWYVWLPVHTSCNGSHHQTNLPFFLFHVLFMWCFCWK